MIGCFKFKSARLTTDFKTQANILSLEVDKSSNVAIRQILNELNENDIYYAEISKPKRKRTLDQNAYMWVLLDRIAQATQQTKELVYKSFIKRVGVFDTLCIQDIALDRFIKSWECKGIGWVCETDTSKIDKCTNVICYYGTSAYTTSEMKRLLDEVITECNELNISTYVDGYKGE